MKKKNRILMMGIWFSLFIAIFAYCQFFLSFNYPFVEQFTFFRFSGEYALSTLREPGGVASYVASFLSQFYLYPAIGPFISAMLAVLITALMDLNLNRISSRYYIPFLSALPALACIWLEADFNYYLSGTVSLVFALAISWAYLTSKRFCPFYMRMLLLMVCSWPLYYALGPNALLMVGLCTIAELNKSDKRSLLSLITIPVAIACPVVLYSLEIGNDLSFQLLPKGYYLTKLSAGPKCYYPWIAVLLNVILAKCLSFFPLLAENERTPRFDRIIRSVWLVAMQFIAIVAMMHWGVQQYNSAKNYEAKVFDYYVRTGQWMELLTDKHLRANQNFMHTCYQNLALSSLNLMGDKMFACPQMGFPGLFIKWNNTVNSSTLLSDVYWQAGDVALAQEMAFEGMIASRDAVNPRLLMRLVQTNLVAGNYPVAEKYINLLADTYSYSAKANEYRTLLYNDEAVLADAELGPRKKGMQGKGLTSAELVAADLELIIESNPSFVPAMHYFGALCLVVKDIPTFAKFIEKYHTSPALAKMPVHFQEAIILAYEKEADRWTELGVTSPVRQRYEQYRKTFIMHRGSPMLERKMAAGFHDTYWYQFMFKK